MAISKSINSLQAAIMARVLDGMDDVVSVEFEGNTLVAFLQAPAEGKPKKITITLTEEEVDSIPGAAWVQAPLFGQK